MINELQKIVNQELAITESKPLVSGELEVALSGDKIVKVQDEDIKQALRYCMLVVGIRANNMPNDIEKAVLIEFIRKHYAGHTCSEIRLAFDMAVTGRLQVESKAYENFSCQYFSSIMNAYRLWAKDEAKYIPVKEETPLLAPYEVDWSNVWEDIKEAAKTDLIEKKVISVKIYEYLIEKGILVLNSVEKKRIFDKAKAQYLVELGDKIIAKKNVPTDISELVILQNSVHIPDNLRLKIQIRSKVLAVRELAKVLCKVPEVIP